MKDFDIFIKEILPFDSNSDCILLNEPKIINIYDEFVNRYNNAIVGKRWRLMVLSVECWNFIKDFQYRNKRYPRVNTIMNAFDFEVLFQQPSLFS